MLGKGNRNGNGLEGCFIAMMDLVMGIYPICLLNLCVMFHFCDSSTFNIYFKLQTQFLCRNGIKREGSGQGNWGTQTDELTRSVFPCCLQP